MCAIGSESTSGGWVVKPCMPREGEREATQYKLEPIVANVASLLGRLMSLHQGLASGMHTCRTQGLGLRRPSRVCTAQGLNKQSASPAYSESSLRAAEEYCKI